MGLVNDLLKKMPPRRQRKAKRGILRAVTMMNIPICYEYTLQIVLLLSVTRSNRHIIEDTESHAPVRGGMVSGRSDNAESPGSLRTHYMVNSIAKGFLCFLCPSGAR